MAIIQGCYLPEELYYDVENHVWVQLLPGGDALVGMTDVAQKLAGKILYVTPKKVGKSFARGKSAATIETEKWVGPLPMPLSGEIAEVNGELKSNPTLINQEPYKAGWILKLRPNQPAEEMKKLLTGQAAIEAYRKKMEAENITCEQEA